MPNTVQATARGGNLTLAGAVRNGAQRAAAEQAVAGLKGIRNVRDQIEVISGDPLGDVTVLVQDALDRYAVLFDNSKVTVSTSGHAVTLTGHVRTWAEHDAAVAAAWMATAPPTSMTRSRSPAESADAYCASQIISGTQVGGNGQLLGALDRVIIIIDYLLQE